MCSVPIVRKISWIAVLPQLAALVLCVSIGVFVSPRMGLLGGAAVYVTYSITSRLLVARDHRQGIWLIKQRRYQDAIAMFQRSLSFFDRHDWINRYRSIVLMSPSAISYREMALANIAFCYMQLGDGRQGRAFYEECLRRFPDSGLAVAALRMMDSVQ
jgi:tetratricopeptide (TPR) repeat protein